MYRKLFLNFILITAFVRLSTAQDVIEAPLVIPAPPPAITLTSKKVEMSAENKKRVAEILRETSSMTAMLNSPDNRISYTLKTASTLWKLDEKEARAMLTGAMNDIRQIIVETDTEMNRIENAAGNDDAALNLGNELWQKTNRITTMRSALVNQLATNDPELGLAFLQDTVKVVTNEELKTRIAANDAYLETTLIGRIAEKDTSKAVELGRKKLSQGVSTEVVGLIQTIYGKDKEKGAAFAEDVFKQINSSGLSADSSWVLSSLYEIGLTSIAGNEKEKPNEKPIFSEQSLRDLANMVAKQITDPLNGNNYYDLTPEFVASLQKYAPQQIGQVKKMAELQRLRAEREKVSPEKPSNFNSNIQKLYESQSKFQAEIGTKVQGLAGENLTSEKRKKIIEEGRSKILESGNKSLKFQALISLATQAAGVGEKDSAVSILEESERLINLHPKEMREFTEVWMLARGYASVKPDRSFALVEDTILRLNDIINAYIKFSEFQNGDAIVENGELKMGDYGGQMFGIFNYLGDLMGNLAEADFTRTKSLADKFERPEFRVETRLMIANSLSQTQNNNNMQRIAPMVRAVD